MPSIPSVLAILTCDQVIVDAVTKKKTLVGIFDRLRSSRFPMQQRIGFYARLTDMEGDYTFTIRVINLTNSEQLIGQMESAQIKATDRLATMEIALNLPPLLFQQPGQYEFQLYANGDFIGRSLVRVESLQPPPRHPQSAG